MTLKQYQQILKLTDYDIEEKFKILGYDASTLSVKNMEKIINDEFNFDMDPKYRKWFRSNGHRFKVCLDIEDLNGGEFSYFQQILGNIRADDIDGEDNIIKIYDITKMNRLFDLSHKLLSVFLVEKTWFKKHISFVEKQEMILNSDIGKVMPLVFFLLKQIEDLPKNIMIYFLNQQKKNPPKEEDLSL